MVEIPRICGDVPKTVHTVRRVSAVVITNLIKANMPSRIAVAASGEADSRMILDMPGADKLMGKGDMLFYPSMYSNPARVQGAYVSDDEVFGVADFLKGEKEC